MAHLTIAASEKTAQTLFETLRDNFSLTFADSVDLGAFSAGLDVKATLAGGTLDLRADNTIQISELDIRYDRLDVSLGIDLGEVCVGGFCIIPNPFGGCLVRAPRFCVFSDDPDIDITLPLGGLLRSEVSVTGSLRTTYTVNPARPAAINDWDAQDHDPSLANHWKLIIDPEFIDLDVLDIPDIVGDLLENAVNAAVDNLLGFLPGWARDLVKSILGPVVDVVRAILDIGDDLDEWLSDLLNVSFGFFDFVLTAIADYFLNRMPLQLFEDPFPILPAVVNPNGPPPTILVPVKIPIRDLSVSNNDVELIIKANVG